MSLGYGASCRKAAEDNKTVIYEYYSYNLNLKDYENVYDGLIVIDKSIVLYEAVMIDNCSYTWKLTEEGNDIMAILLARRILTNYNETGLFIEGISLDY